MTEKEIMDALEFCKDCSININWEIIGLISRQQSEIKWLKEALQTQTDILESGANSNEFCFEEDKIRAEAIKVFVEKLKEISVENTYWGGKTIYKMVSLSRIEQIAEEMVGARDE